VKSKSDDADLEVSEGKYVQYVCVRAMSVTVLALVTIDGGGVVLVGLYLLRDARLARCILSDTRFVFCMTKVPLGPQLTVLRIV